jgi:hypothetical protein
VGKATGSRERAPDGVPTIHKALHAKSLEIVRSSSRHSGARALRKIDYVNFVAKRASPESIAPVVAFSI